MRRGALYVTWGDSHQTLLERSRLSLEHWHPGLEIRYCSLPAAPPEGLLYKARMFTLSPFDVTLYLDADTVVLGDLTRGFEMAERHTLACCINECPWLRRYGVLGDVTEYNTGVLFFSRAAADVFRCWQTTADIEGRHGPTPSRWLEGGRMRGSACDDQLSFAQAVHVSRCNPHVLPHNYNFRPGFHRNFFAPLKVWHSPLEVPPALALASRACEKGERPVTHYGLEEFPA